METKCGFYDMLARLHIRYHFQCLSILYLPYANYLVTAFLLNNQYNLYIHNLNLESTINLGYFPAFHYDRNIWYTNVQNYNEMTIMFKLFRNSKSEVSGIVVVVVSLLLTIKQILS